jgi:hypothetical protein
MEQYRRGDLSFELEIDGLTIGERGNLKIELFRSEMLVVNFVFPIDPRIAQIHPTQRKRGKTCQAGVFLDARRLLTHLPVATTFPIANQTGLEATYLQGIEFELSPQEWQQGECHIELRDAQQRRLPETRRIS